MRFSIPRGLVAGAIGLTAIAAGVFSPVVPGDPAVAAGEPSLTFVARYATGLTGGSSGEVVAYENNRMYVTNAIAARLDIVDLNNSGVPTLFASIDMKPFFTTDHDGNPATATELTSVAVKSGIVAATLKADYKVSPGKVVFLSRDGEFLADVAVGSLPDMVTFSTLGLRLLVANEGEPNWYGNHAISGAPGTDPEGSVTIISVLPYLASYRFGSVAPGAVKTVSFADFNIGERRNAELPAGVRIFGPGATVAQDLEPEYITVGPDQLTAYVTLQENNAVAVINILAGRVEKILALGFKDHSLAGNGFDPTDRDGIGNSPKPGNIKTWPVKGVYMPDAIDSFQVGAQTYFVTANEGDAREYLLSTPPFAEEARASTLTVSAALQPFFTAAPPVEANDQLARLNVTKTLGHGGDTTYEELYSFGARSFSIWDASTGAQVFDSGDDIEQHIATLGPAVPFNPRNDNVNVDDRSDNKGPEPEALVIGTVGDRTYAFVGLERQGGVMVYDITDPASAAFVTYFTSRDYSAAMKGDSGPEVLVFIAASESPTEKPLLLISNELSGTVAVVQID